MLVSLMESLSTTFLEKGEAQGAAGVMRGISSAPRLQMTLRYPSLFPFFSVLQGYLAILQGYLTHTQLFLPRSLQ
jgi:hypothetical protein